MSALIWSQTLTGSSLKQALICISSTDPSLKKKPVTWFNPPYSLNVATNVAREFLKLVDTHFPPENPLHSTVNRTTVKVSYRALPNMGAKIARHNAKILKNVNKNSSKPKPSCNCRIKEDCPIPGACNQSGVIYQATVKNNKGTEETYIGLASKFNIDSTNIKLVWKQKIQKTQQPFQHISGKT